MSSWQVLLGPDDAVLSDELNHASIIDGIRLCRAKRLRYKHMDLDDLEGKLKESQVSVDKYKRRFNAPIKQFSGSITSEGRKHVQFNALWFSWNFFSGDQYKLIVSYELNEHSITTYIHSI